MVWEFFGVSKSSNLELKTLANQVEHTGNILQTQEFDFSKEQETKAQSESTNQPEKKPNLLYVGVDGVMTPLNQKQGYKEARIRCNFLE